MDIQITINLGDNAGQVTITEDEAKELLKRLNELFPDVLRPPLRMPVHKDSTGPFYTEPPRPTHIPDPLPKNPLTIQCEGIKYASCHS